MKSAIVFLAEISLLTLAACDFSSSIPHIDYPDKQSPAFNVYANNCSGCHAPPLPDAHPPLEWPGVIERMQQHRMQSHMPAIDAKELLVLRDYLMSHAVRE